MIKIAMIGAGSVVFCKTLTGDILSYPEFHDARLTYMDVDARRLEVGAALARKVAAGCGAKPDIRATLDRRAALAEADVVIVMAQVGGFDATLIDFEIPRKYGLNFTIADTTGPGGLFRALRTFNLLRDIGRDMESICPRALLINYSNPMSMNMRTITATTSVRAVGLCHSVQGTFLHLMHCIGEDPAKVAFTCAGINHMAFYLRLEKDGVDLYPRLFAAMDDPGVYDSDRVRFELLKRLGYFVTESSEHNAEYNPFFIPHGQRTIERFAVPIDEYLRRCDRGVEGFHRLASECHSPEPIPVRKSPEYGSTIIHSLATGQPAVVYGNLPNRGVISNLPADAIVECPTMADRTGVALTHIGDLPPQLVAYVQPHVSQHELFIRAVLEHRRDHVYQAVMFDPLTAATLPLDDIVQMCDELIAAHGDLLPPLPARTLVPTSGIQFPPLDPADLRRQWHADQSRRLSEYIRDWLVLGPFPSDTPGRVRLDFPTEFERRLAERGHGSIDRTATYAAGNKQIAWTPAPADDHGLVNLGDAIGTVEWAIAYAYAEFHSATARQAELRCGSDDGIRIWLNGRQIHTHEIGRPYRPDSDRLVVPLIAGPNRLLVKIDNYQGGWGFGVAIGNAKTAVDLRSTDR